MHRVIHILGFCSGVGELAHFSDGLIIMSSKIVHPCEWHSPGVQPVEGKYEIKFLKILKKSIPEYFNHRRGRRGFSTHMDGTSSRQVDELIEEASHARHRVAAAKHRVSKGRQGRSG